MLPLVAKTSHTLECWIKAVFPNYRKEMRGVEFGPLYNEFKNKKIDSKKIEKEIAELMQDEDVTKNPEFIPMF